MDRPQSLEFTDEPAANRLLAQNPMALLIGMLLDQQITMEKAFRGPHDLSQRLGMDLAAIPLAAVTPERMEEVFRERPALHRFPKSMADRTHALCSYIAEHYDGSPERIWDEAADGADLVQRLEALPGYGTAKARIFVAILGKRLGIRPPGWERSSADWSSIADVTSFADVQAIRAEKRRRRGGARH